MATEFAIAIKVGAAIGGAVGAFQSLGKSIQGLTTLTNKLELEHLELGNTIQKYMGKSDLIVGDLTRKYDKLGNSIDKLKAKQLALNAGIAKRELLAKEKEELKDKVVGTVGMAMTAVAPIKMAIDFESAMADVKKVVDFQSPDGFKHLSKDLLELTRILPMTATELAQITAAGGQLGIAEQDLKEFTTTIAKMSVAFDMSADESGDAMAKLANVYKIPISNIGNLGDAINELSNSSPAKASDIVNTLGRVGGVAKAFGLTENAAAALSNSFISLGKAPEVAGTAINGMLTKLMTADKGGKKFQAALQQVGISAKELKTSIAKDGQGALTDFLKRLEKLPKEKRMGILVDLFGLEYADDVSVLAGSVDVLEKSLKTLQETDEKGSPKYLGSMQKEFAARSATTANNLKLLKNNAYELGISLGSVLLPAINETINNIRPVVSSITDWASANPELTKSIMGVGTALATARIVSLGVRFGWVGLKNTANEIGIVINKFSANWLANTIALQRSKYATILAEGGYKSLARTVVSTGRAMLFSPMGAAISAIAVGGLVIYKFWKPLKAFFSGFIDGVSQGLAPLKPTIESIGSAFSSIWNGLSPIVSPVLDFFRSLFSLEQAAEGGARSVGEAVGLFIGNAISTVANLISTAWGSVTTFFSNLWTTLSTSVTQFISTIGQTILNFNPLALFQTAFSTVLSWFSIDLPMQFSNFGKNIIDGLVGGISNAWNLAKEKVSELGSGIKGWFAEQLGIHSPSRVFKGYGVNVVEGLVIGMDKAQSLATEASQHLSNAVTFEPVLNTVETVFKPTLSKEKGFFGSLWDDIQFGANMVGNLLGLNQPMDLRTPSFNPQAKDGGLFADYQPLNRNEVANTETTHNQGITVHFSPNITISGSTPAPDLKEQLLQALNDPAMLYGLEQLLNRVNDQFGRRAY